MTCARYVAQIPPHVPPRVPVGFGGGRAWRAARNIGVAQVPAFGSSCFDEYQYTPLPECVAGGFPIPFQAYYSDADKRIKKHHVEGWKNFTTESCAVYETKGNHLFFFDVPARAEYMEKVVSRLPSFA